MRLAVQACKNIIEALIEIILGMANVEAIAIAAALGRLETTHFGVADYAASNCARTQVIDRLNDYYPRPGPLS
ncbi:Malyl-CoA lyase [hydrothermal vent metagenome]|uniref:Malyl-CoA lyase n=1 Tax=hydrothermal vent metagenome TaxID=652676 RepID=A0A3B0RSD3_9ZZZZ